MRDGEKKKGFFPDRGVSGREGGKGGGRKKTQRDKVKAFIQGEVKSRDAGAVREPFKPTSKGGTQK